MCPGVAVNNVYSVPSFKDPATHKGTELKIEGGEAAFAVSEALHLPCMECKRL